MSEALSGEQVDKERKTDRAREHEPALESRNK